MPKPGKFLWIYTIAVVVYLLLPIIIIVPISFSPSPVLAFPPTGFTLDWYAAYFGDRLWITPTLLSFKVAAISAALAVAVGTAAAIAMERGASRFRNALSSLFSLPIVVPHIFIAIGIFLVAFKVGLVDSAAMLIAAHAAVSSPFVFLMVASVLRQMDNSSERAARILGAGPFRAFRDVVLPHLMPSMIAGYVIAFFLSFDELVIALFLMSGQETLPMRIWANLRFDITPVVAAVAAILTFVTTAAMISAELWRRRATRASLAGPG